MLSPGSKLNMCWQCSAQLRPGTRFCPACGAPIASINTVPPAVPQVTNEPAPSYQYHPLQPGQEIDKYRIMSLLSKGGMGAVYLARDLGTFNRTVVIKEMLDYFDPADQRAVAQATARFRAEAETLAGLRHSGIPKIYAFFSIEASNYIVMEYIEGQDLAQGLLQRQGQGFPQQQVMRWGITLCGILKHLAENTPPVIHHDIKPANVILDDNTGDVRLVDFGTARARLVKQVGGGVGVQKSSIYGTAGYAAPEQYSGDSEPRSDVYALAATLYHLATGDEPDGLTFGFPRLNTLGRFGRALERALARDVAQRSTAAELRHELEAILAAATMRPIQAPDGEEIRDELKLVEWCEKNWDHAASWLYKGDTLPQQIAHLWGKTQLADQLRACVSTHSNNWDIGLDAALATCDPQGFDSAPMAIEAVPAQLHFGRVAACSHATNKLVLHNSGRRVVQAQVEAPSWISVPASVTIAPGAADPYDIVADTSGLKLGGNVNGAINLMTGSQQLAQVPVSARVSRVKTLWHRYLAPSLARHGRPVGAPTSRAFPHMTRFVIVGLAIAFITLIMLFLPIGNPLLKLGIALFGIGYIGFIVQGTRQHRLWPVLFVLVYISLLRSGTPQAGSQAVVSPLILLILPIVFTVKYWSRAKVPFFLTAGGTALMAFSAAIMPLDRPVTITSRSSDFQITMPATWSTWDVTQNGQLPEGLELAVKDPSGTTFSVYSYNQALLGEKSAQDVAQGMAEEFVRFFQNPSTSGPIELQLGGSPAVQYTIRGRLTKTAIDEMASFIGDTGFASSIDPGEWQTIKEQADKGELPDWIYIVTVAAGREKLYLLVLSTPSSDSKQHEASLHEVIGSFTFLPAPQGARSGEQLFQAARVTGRLHLRHTPDPVDQGNVITVLQPGTEVDILEETSIESEGQQVQWMRVRIHGTTTEGWVNAQYLEAISR